MSLTNKLLSALRWCDAALSQPKLTAINVVTLPFQTRGRRFSIEPTFSNPEQKSKPRFHDANPLKRYFLEHHEGPGIWKWMHYFDIYQKHFSKFVGREVHVVEIGIYSGGSLPMWRQYFGDHSHIYGVDIEEACRSYESDRIKVMIGDQADRSFWAEFKKAVPIIDIVIDDGGHLAEQQLVTMEELLPHLSPGGVYLCEDITTVNNRFAAYLQGLSNNLNSASWCSLDDGTPGIASVTSPFQNAIGSIHFYPFVAVIEKNEQTVSKLISPKQGTVWQPFL